MRRFLCNTFLAISLLLGDKAYSNPQQLGPTEDDTYFEKSIEIYSPPSRELTEIESSRCTYKDEAFHVPTKSCYSIATQGPCNLYETWFATSLDSDEGYCYCKYNPWGRSDVNQPIVRSSKDKRCYPVFSQAACEKQDEWFVAHPTMEGFGHCEPNPCINASTEGSTYVNETLMFSILYHYETENLTRESLFIKPFWFMHRGKCVQTFTLGTCGPPGGNHTLFFKGTDPTPICVDIETARYRFDTECSYEFNQLTSEDESSETEQFNNSKNIESTEVQYPGKSNEQDESNEEEGLEDNKSDYETKIQEQTTGKNVTWSGFCNFHGALHIPSNVCYETNGRGVETFVNQPVSRSVDNHRCYRIFSQGNCLRGDEWFVQHPNKTGFGHCELNPCINLSTKGFNYVTKASTFRLLGDDVFTQLFHKTIIPEEPFWFLHEGKCIKTFTKGTCGPPGSNHTMFFVGTEPQPGCTYPACEIENENFTCRDLLTNNCVDVGAVEPNSRTNYCPHGFIKHTNDCSYNATVPVDDSDY